MFVPQYNLRLPADYEMGLIRKRAAERDPSWGVLPPLYCEVGFR
jgi:hypothetical protein